ncbi:MAG: N-acetyl-gamma-glutamyl-phosphate reductase [Rhodospirillaceae bacterium]|nr:N-acetyl-gamma-glutamyl-phosphate reductase [Rhodospirillaceae bacterium]MBL6930299.1 N-acetyl-gamma-glutamyl-phosphate reductase [Rhodospirillales bacterium]MBL6940651.1 N-acetyl-gamma-glutamyl-phosphate reductase [Rhodospirillales bacterium]
MSATVFIDGEVGTTGLQIRERLGNRADLSFLSLDEIERKDLGRRGDMLNSADIVILCLPDDAARDAVAMIENTDVRVIDASSAHRVATGWVYGMPEYGPGQAELIAAASRVTNPGCYAITSVSILHPLVAGGIVPASHPVTINAISGYSGGGKQMIADFEDAENGAYANTPFRVYGLGLAHKHVPEIKAWSGLDKSPLMVPSVGHFRQGMIVQVPLQLWSLPGNVSVGDIHAALENHYAGQRFVKVKPLAETADMSGLEPEGLNGTNELHLHVFGNAEAGQAVVMGLIDNLGKGASGQAVQNLNLMIGADPDTGL